MAQVGTRRIEACRGDGYLCPIDIFSPAEAARHRAAVEAQVAESGDGGLALYEEAPAAQSATLTDGASEPVGLYASA